MTPVTKLLRELIALPSVNPALVPAGDPHAGEHRVGAYLVALASKAKLEVELQPVAPDRSNVLIKIRPKGPVRRRVLLAPHMDTVGVSNECEFVPTLRNGRLYGRGACDTKGSFAAMLTAFLARAAQRPDSTEIIFCGLVDEEVHQAGSRHLVKEFGRTKHTADLAIVGEPTRCQVVTAHKGDLWLELETRGKAAHGARPDLGRNAVHAMARVVELLETKYAAALRRRRHPLLGCATVNVGAIAGGRQPNIVPDRCVIKVDRRTIPGENDATVKRDLLRFLRRQGHRVTMADSKGEAPAPALQTDIRLPLVRQLLQVAGQRRPAGVDFFSDAGVLGAGGIPSVVFGPGDIAQAHTVDEWIAVSQLERATTILTRFLRSLE